MSCLDPHPGNPSKRVRVERLRAQSGAIAPAEMPDREDDRAAGGARGV